MNKVRKMCVWGNWCGCSSGTVISWIGVSLELDQFLSGHGEDIRFYFKCDERSLEGTELGESYLKFILNSTFFSLYNYLKHYLPVTSTPCHFGAIFPQQPIDGFSFIVIIIYLALFLPYYIVASKNRVFLFPLSTSLLLDCFFIFLLLNLITVI